MPIEYVVQEGDGLNSIALDHGHCLETLRQHPRNAALRSGDRNPDVLLPGEIVVVPEIQPKDESRGTGRRHAFVRRGIPEKLVLQLKLDGEPQANVDYVLVVGDAVFSGKTDGQGRLSHPVRPAAREGTLTVGAGAWAIRYALRLGSMRPVSDLAGVRSRLANLGYDPGPNEEPASGQFGEALRAFQLDRDLPETGEPDDSTRAALARDYGC